MSDAATPTVTASAGPAAVTPAAHRPGRRVRIALRALQAVLALFFGIASAFPKLVGHSSAVESFDRIGFGDWYMHLIGGLELAGAVALLIPLLSGVAALAFIGLMIGAFVTQVTVFDGQYAITPLILIVPLALVAWTRRRHNAELVALLRRRA
ncbi:DoxX family protein [Streptomyces sp. NPDC051219]|uniref:DoxX family protein n=1 Tax=Streptomyces sp. NPDC051219 TaxID=3155283 RepID=UPI00343EC9B4